jgi:hypothetical protein
MRNFGARKMLWYLAPAVTPLSLVLVGLLGRWGIYGLRHDRGCSVAIEEMLLPRCFGDPFAPRSQPEAFHRLVLLLEAIIGALQFDVGSASLVKLALQVAKLNLHRLKLPENAAKQLLAGGQIIRDVSGSLHHDYIYVFDGAL